MRITQLFGLLTAWPLLSTTLYAAEIPLSQFQVANWVGAAYTSDDNGVFSHCAISAEYMSGDVLHFSVNRQASISVAVYSPALLGVPVGQSFPVSLVVDRRTSFTGTATILLDGFAGLEISDFNRALEVFKRGYVLTVQGAGRTGQYNLTGTFRALEAARECAIRNFNYAAVPAKPAPVPRTYDKTVTFQLATTILTGLEIKEFRFLTQAELDELGQSDSVAWVSPEHGLMGWSLMLPREQGQSDLRVTDAGDTAFLAERCAGDYATSARALQLGDGQTARELRVVCADEDGTTEHFVSKFFAGDFVVYNALTFFPQMQGQTDGRSLSDLSQQATLRAASFVIR